MLIISPDKKIFYTTDNLTHIYICPVSDGGQWGLFFCFIKERYAMHFKSETIAQRNFDNIVRAYHEGHREVYLEE